MSQIIFYGCGNISQTIIKGLILDGCTKKNILYIDRNPLNKKKLSRYGIKSADQSKLTTTKNLIILAVKPKDALAACKEISTVISAPQLISLVAGIKIKSLKKSFSSKASIVRAMPTTASTYKKGITAIYGERNSEKLILNTKKLFSRVGISILLKEEEEMNNFTGLIGSGPAYFFYLLKIYNEHLLNLCDGKQRDVDAIIVNFLEGISSSISDGIDFDMAIDLIASKKGTTEAGINSLKDNNVLQLFEKGIISAMKRSKEISDEYK